METYAARIKPTDPRNIGLQNLAVAILGLAPNPARIVSALVGISVLAALLAWRPTSPESSRGGANPVGLIAVLVGPMFFGVRSYDLVLVIPVFVWFLSAAKSAWWARPGSISCLVFLLPLTVVERVYRLASSHSPHRIGSIASRSSLIDSGTCWLCCS